MLKDAAGNCSATVDLRHRRRPGAGRRRWRRRRPGHPARQRVSVPGDHNSEMGCAGRLGAGLRQAQLTLDPKDEIWKGTYTPPGRRSYAYKVAINKTLGRELRRRRRPNGANIAYTAPGRPGHVLLRPRHALRHLERRGPDRHGARLVPVRARLPAATGRRTACGRGCRTRTATAPTRGRTSELPAGSYEVKVAHDLGWDENYGAGGAPGGANIPFTVPGDGLVTTFSLRARDARADRDERRRPAPRRTWPRRRRTGSTHDLVAWPATRPGRRRPASSSRWRLHWSPTAALGVDAEAVTGGVVRPADARPGAGCPAVRDRRSSRRWQGLSSRCDCDATTATRAGDPARAGRGRRSTTPSARLLDATGVQIPGVLDDLYAGSAAQAHARRDLARRSRRRFALWAPTAQDGRPADLVGRVSSRRAAMRSCTATTDGVVVGRRHDGRWTGAPYLLRGRRSTRRRPARSRPTWSPTRTRSR